MTARLGLAVGLALAAGPVGLALTAKVVGAQDPPVWAYLAECSAVFRAAALADGYAGATPGQIAAIEEAVLQFRAQAVKVAGDMGQVDPKADVASIMVYLEPRWENRIDRLFSVKSNLDWISYCGRLGREQNVPTPDFTH